MTDDSKNRGGGGRGRPPRDDSRRPGSRTERPSRPRDAGDRPRRDDGDRPFRARSGDDRPARPRREDGDRPFRARSGDDRPARPRREDADRPFRARSGDDRPARPRREDSDRPFRARSGDDRPARPRREDGDRPFRARSGEDRPFRPRREDGERSFRPRFEDRGRGAGPDRREKGPKIRKTFKDRVAKVIARAGLCSRRDAEAWIEEGRVAVNGEVLTSPALDVTERDVVMVDGKPIPTKERTRLFLYHKPAGLVTTAWDPEGRPTVFASLPPGLPRVVTIGRLDINTEGLLLLTNDGGLARVISHPSTGWLRRYRVRAYGSITQADLDALADGITVDDMHYGPIEAEIQREQGDNVWLTLGLREGKNREVKRVLEHLGLQVNRLIRVSFGPFQLNDLPEGSVEEVRTAILKDQLGETLAAEAEVDFDAPVFVYEDEDFHPKKREWQGRGDEGDRPARRPRDDDRGFGDRDGDRPRGRFGRDREESVEEKPRPKRRAPTEPLRSIWRADEDPDAPRTPKARVPRRGADPKAARSESGERTHERAGRIESPKGRKVLVERVKSEPREEIREDEPRRAPRADRQDKPFRPRREEGDRPFRARSEGGDRPFRSRSNDDRPARPRREEGDRPFRARGEGGERPFRSRTNDDRPAHPRREEGDRPFRARSEGGDRPFRSRSGDDRPARPRREEGDRPFRARSEGGDRPFRSRSNDDRPARPRREEGDRPFRARSEGGDRPFRSRSNDDRSARPRREEGDRPFRARGEGGDRPARPRSEGGDRPFKPRGGPGGGRPGGGRPSGGAPRRPRRDDR